MQRREFSVKARLTEVEKKNLVAVAKRYETTESEMARQLIDYGMIHLFGEEMDQRMGQEAGISERRNALSGVTPHQLIRVLFTLSEISSKIGMTEQYDYIISEILRHTPLGEVLNVVWSTSSEEVVTDETQEQLLEAA